MKVSAKIFLFKAVLVGQLVVAFANLCLSMDFGTYRPIILMTVDSLRA